MVACHNYFDQFCNRSFQGTSIGWRLRKSGEGGRSVSQTGTPGNPSRESSSRLSCVQPANLGISRTNAQFRDCMKNKAEIVGGCQGELVKQYQFK